MLRLPLTFGLSLRLRLVLAFGALVALIAVVAIAAFQINHSVRREVSDLQARVGVDLVGLDLSTLGLEIEGYWDPAGTFVANEVEVFPGARKPKLRGTIQAADPAAGTFTMYGRVIALRPDTELRTSDDASPFEVLLPGRRAEVTCDAIGGQWSAELVDLRNVKASDKLKATATSWEIDGEIPESLEIHGLHVTLAMSRDESPGSALRQVRLATRLTLLLYECRAVAHELLGDEDDALRPDVETEMQLDPDADARGPATPAERLRRSVADFRYYIEQATDSERKAGIDAASGSASRWLGRLAEQELQLRRHVETLLDLAPRQPAAAQRHIDEVFDPFLLDEVLPLVYALQRQSEEELDEQLAAFVSRSDDTTRVALIISGVAVVAAMVLAFLVWRSVHRPLVALHAAARSLGRGELDSRVVLPGKDEFSVLAEAFNRMASELARSTVSIGNLEGVFDSMSGALFLLDPEGRIERTNRAAEVLLGHGAGELVGQAFEALCITEAGDSWQAAMRSGPGGIVPVTERVLRRRDGSTVAVTLSGAELRPRDGSLKGYVCVAQDRTAWKLFEDRIRDSLAEKELLLREVHHRVKNNLQVISSLLDMQAATMTDTLPGNPFEESQSRIRSMALIHEQLYQSPELQRIDVPAYVDALTRQLDQSFGRSGEIALQLRVGDLALDIDQAIACGLIINELVVNAFKHAFPDGRRGTIRVVLDRTGDGQCTLSVGDDGQGMVAPHGFQRPRGLGSNLVRMLVKQLRGQLHVEKGAGVGAEVRIVFPLAGAA